MPFLIGLALSDLVKTDMKRLYAIPFFMCHALRFGMFLITNLSFAINHCAFVFLKQRPMAESKQASKQVFLIQHDCSGSVSSVSEGFLIAYDYPCTLLFTDTD